MSVDRFGWPGVAARGLFSLFIVFAVYNPSGRSFVHWVLSGFEYFWFKLAVGAALAATLSVMWRTTIGVIGWRGVSLVGIFSLGLGMSVLPLAGTRILAGETLLLWALVSIAGVFTAGLCYSHLHHRLGGISHTEDVLK